MAKKYNCEKNGIKYYRKTKTIGHDMNGNPIKKEFYGDGEKDCLKQIDEFMEKRKRGLIVDSDKLTVQEAMYDWLFKVLIHSKNKKSASFEKHETNYRIYIKNSPIGFLLIQNTNSTPFQEYYTKLYEKGIDIKDKKTGKVKHKTISENKIFDLNKTLRTFFNYCIKQKYTLNNPCSLENIELPGNADGQEDEADEEGNNIQAFNDKELKTITSNIYFNENEDNTFNVAVHLSLLTGLRLGELLGLKRKFVTGNMIKVRNTLKKVKIFDSSTKWHYEQKLISPKSKSSIRNVSIPSTFSVKLDLYFVEQKKKWKEQGLKFNDNSLIFTTKTCNSINQANFRRAWKRFLNRINVDYKKPHSMRDTYATALIRRGAPIHEIKELLGHSNITITEKYYIYVFPEDKSKTANLLNDLVS